MRCLTTEMIHEAARLGVCVHACSVNDEADLATVKFLNDRGIPAVVTEGGCPILEDYEKSQTLKEL